MTENYAHSISFLIYASVYIFFSQMRGTFTFITILPYNLLILAVLSIMGALYTSSNISLYKGTTQILSSLIQESNLGPTGGGHNRLTIWGAYIIIHV